MSRRQLHRPLLGLLFCALAVPVAGQTITSRFSRLNFNYVFGGGGDSHTGNDFIEDIVILPSDAETLQFADSTSGILPGEPPCPYSAGVSCDLSHSYSVTGPMPGFQTITASASTGVSATVAGCGTSVIHVQGPGNELDFYFTVASRVRCRLAGTIQHPFAGAQGPISISLEYFNGFNWGYEFWSAFLPGGQGPFDISRTLIPGQYRITAFLGVTASGGDSWLAQYQYRFDVFTPCDMNCDGVVNGLDVQGFVEARLEPTAYASHYPQCNVWNADVDFDNDIDDADATQFVQCVLDAG